MFPVRLCPFGLLDSMRSIAALTWIAAFLFVPTVSRAHEGHDHDESTRSALASSTYPRVTAQSELYEVVGILKGERLSIYLDRAATNAPVTDAKVSVTIGDGEAIDTEPAENGTYAVSSPRLSGTGSVEIVFAVTANNADLLVAPSRCRRRPRPARARARPPVRACRNGSPRFRHRSEIRSC